MVADPVIEIVPMMEMVAEMINDNDVKVVQNEEPRKEKVRDKEGVRHPRIEVIIVIWRRIVGDYRRTFLIVIILNFRGLNVLSAFRWLIFSILACCRCNR